MRRRIVRSLLIFLSGLALLGLIALCWLFFHPEFVNKKIDTWAKEFATQHPLVDSVEIHWEGIEWQPWRGIRLAEVKLGDQENYVAIYGLTLNGIGYSNPVIGVEQLHWDSLWVVGQPNASWLHWMDPWIDSADSGSAFAFSIEEIGGRILWKPNPTDSEWTFHPHLSNFVWNTDGAPTFNASLAPGLANWSEIYMHGGKEGQNWELSMQSAEFSLDVHVLLDSIQTLIQWDWLGIPWEATASGILLGDSSYQNWQALGTQAFWRERLWNAEGGYHDGRWDFTLQEQEGNLLLAKLAAFGTLNDFEFDLDWNQWRAEILQLDWEGWEVNGTSHAKGHRSSQGSWDWSYTAQGNQIAKDNLQVLDWKIEAKGSHQEIMVNLAAKEPYIGQAKFHYNFGAEYLNFQWAWDENMHYLDSLGLPARGELKGNFSWANGGSAHIETTKNSGYLACYLDWNRGTSGKHEMEARLGSYRAGFTALMSPLEWRLPENLNIEYSLSQWLDGEWKWSKEQGIQTFWADGPKWKARYEMKNGYQRIEASGDWNASPWSISSAAPMKNLRPVESQFHLLLPQGMLDLAVLSRKDQEDLCHINWDWKSMNIAGHVGWQLDRKPAVWSAHLLPSSVSLLGHHSAIQGGMDIRYDWRKGKLSLGQGIQWQSPVGSIAMSGALSADPFEVMRIQCSDFPLKDWTAVFTESLPVEGNLWGQFILAGAIGSWNTSADLWIPELTLEGQSLGSVESQWDVDIQTGDVNMRAQAGWGDSLWLLATGDRKTRWDIELTVDRLPLNYLEPFTEGSLEQWGGQIMAEVILREEKKGWNLLGRGELHEASFLLPSTGVSYYGSPRLKFRQRDIQLTGILKDHRNKGQIQLNGVYDYYAAPGKSISLRMEGDRFLALDLAKGEDFYGEVLAKGFANLSGGFSGLRLEVDATPLDSSVFALPMDAPVTLEDASFITFKSRQKGPLIRRNNSKEAFPKAEFQFDFGLSVHVNPDITARIILDETVGDVIEGKGSGDLRIDFPHGGDLQMNGLLTLQEGTYLFTLQNLVNKPFSVEPGATLSWSGDPYHADVNLTAIYKTRTNPSTYLGLVNQERLAVDVMLEVTGDLMQPDLGFDIQLPTANSATQAALQSRLVTPDEKTTQVLSMLTLHSFWDQGQGWSATGVSALETNTTQVLAQQFSNFMAQGLGENWDVQLAYASDSKALQRQMDASIGRSFLDNRLKVMTEWGIPMGSQQANMGLGDLTLSYQLTADGRWMASAYSVRNSDMAFTGQPVAQKQGLGIQAQFMGSSWAALWKKWFAARKD
ncbi:MAG: translocation/assembly module TamB domain-containing protein [Schleiferiaceae bacterium]|nr:translocation/assembly module TamB domain-containing protein [Schleiferiaceae bacterium]